MHPIPVIALTGHLGAGKTSLLNHVLGTPDARIGVVINDFGAINVDAALVTGQVDEPASIAGGCICCLPDDDGLDTALRTLADPRLRLDAIVVESSGLAEPLAVARLIRFSGVDGIRAGGVVDVVDAVHHFDTVDRGDPSPARYGAASLVVVTKLDQLSDDERPEMLARVTARVRTRNPDAPVVGAVGGRIDPQLLFDVGGDDGAAGQLSFRELWVHGDADRHHHVHAHSVTVTSAGGVDPGAVLDLLEAPPAGVYRAKGMVAVGGRGRHRGYAVHLVGRSVHVISLPSPPRSNSLVAIGSAFDEDAVRVRMTAAVRPAAATASGLRRWQRVRRLSV